MHLRTFALLSALLCSSLIIAQDITANQSTSGDTTKTTKGSKYNLILDPSISFGPIGLAYSEALIEGSIGLERITLGSPHRRRGLKANLGLGYIWIGGITDSGDWNGISNVYSLEIFYNEDFYRRKSKHKLSTHSFFVESGIESGGFNQNITTLYTWNDPVDIDQKRYGIFTGVKIGVGYRYNYREKITLSLIPFSTSIGYINTWSSWDGFSTSLSGVSQLYLHLMDLQILIPLVR